MKEFSCNKVILGEESDELLDSPGLISIGDLEISDRFEILVPVLEEDLEGFVIIASSSGDIGGVLINEHLENILVRVQALAGNTVVGQDVFQMLQTKDRVTVIRNDSELALLAFFLEGLKGVTINVSKDFSHCDFFFISNVFEEFLHDLEINGRDKGTFNVDHNPSSFTKISNQSRKILFESIGFIRIAFLESEMILDDIIDL